MRNLGYFSEEMKTCASCKYWYGARRMDSISFKIEPIEDFGKCHVSLETECGNMKEPMDFCKKWESIIDK